MLAIRYMIINLLYSSTLDTHVNLILVSNLSYLVLSRWVPDSTLTYPLNIIFWAAGPSFTVSVMPSRPWEYNCGTPHVAVGVCNPSSSPSSHVRAGTVMLPCTILTKRFARNKFIHSAGTTVFCVFIFSDFNHSCFYTYYVYSAYHVT